MTSTSQAAVLAALQSRPPQESPWWDDALCRPVAFAGWRPAVAGRDDWGVTWSPVDPGAPLGAHGLVSSIPTNCAGRREGEAPLAGWAVNQASCAMQGTSSTMVRGGIPRPYNKSSPGRGAALPGGAGSTTPAPIGRDRFRDERRGGNATPSAQRGRTPSSPGSGAALYASAHPACRAADLLSLRFPDGGDPAPFSGLREQAPAAGAALTIGLHPLGPLDRLSALLGAERALPALLDEPEACRAAVDLIADYHVRIAENYLAAGVEAGWLADDYAGDAGPLVRPALWRELFLPGLARIIAVYRDAGALCFFHTCGRADDLLPDLLAAGVTAFNLEPGVCDLPGLRARFGPAIAFIGCPAWLGGV